MKQKSVSVRINSSKSVTLFLLVVVMISLIASCHKITTLVPNAGFIGTWKGTSLCYANYNTDTFTNVATEYIGKGGDDNSLSIGAWFGLNVCYKAVSVAGTVNGYNFSIAPQTVLDNCGNSYLTGGSAHLTSTSSTLTMSTYITDALGTSTCIFTGVKD